MSQDNLRLMLLDIGIPGHDLELYMYTCVQELFCGHVLFLQKIFVHLNPPFPKPTHIKVAKSSKLATELGLDEPEPDSSFEISKRVLIFQLKD